MSHTTTEFMGTPDELFHWIPGEMVIVVRLAQAPRDDSLDVLVEQIRVLLNAFLASYNLAVEHYGTHGRWNDSPMMPSIQRHAFVFGLHRKQPLIAIFFHTRRTDSATRDPVPTALSYVQSHLDELSKLGLHIVSAMPNWLVTAAPVFYGDGGLALPPCPAPSLDVATADNALVGWQVTLLDQRIQLDSKGAEDVLVAVLDTAHHPDRIRSAATRSELQRNWLLQRLVSDLSNEDGSFVIEYDRYALTNDIRTGRDLHGDPRYYFMPDHGVSVSGLIRDVARQARIRLIRVLNDFGGGDLYSLFAALTDLERELASGTLRHLVINLSLTMLPDMRHLPYVWFDQRQWPNTQIAGVMHVLNHIEEGLRLLFDSLAAQGALIVAAAGNNSTGARTPLSPRAPARYDTTLSVTSVNSNFEPAKFANAANVAPFTTGVATFGGDAYGAKDTNGLPDAVRGIYISPTFPGGEQNTSGWADLCGSSFATAIISALGAHLLAQGLSVPDAIARLAALERRGEALFGAPVDVPALLANVIRVQQRFRPL
ncbi:MAG: S8 family serine peptidase [Ktedonobacteraceae bacterium]|nr:S8 family serine peptidase [Ktedonobacteraceae bacterium]